ncbi:MAG: oligosaccharide flippase family protein [Prevotellaceae bacterium]|nr:oligosaccharide flippase family protein [Prevotellaceae bacterium]
MKNIGFLTRCIKNSSDGKTVLTNFGYLSLLQVAGYIFPLLTMPYLAKTIGSDGFGKIAFASAVIVWFQTITDWGFNFTSTRDVAQNRDDKLLVSQIFSNVLWARCFLTIISGLLLFVLTCIIPVFHCNKEIILFTFLMVPGHILFPDWFFQAIERMKYTTILNLLLKFIFTIAVFVFIKEKDDYLLQPLITSVGYLLCGFISLYIILRKWEYKIYAPNVGTIYITIKNSFDVFLNNLMPNLYNSFSIILLGQFGGPNATGIFDGGNRFITIINQLQSVLSRAFFPFLSRRANKFSLFSKINMAVAFFFSIALFVSAPLIVKIMLAPEFADSIVVLRILSVSIIFMAMNVSYGQNYLIISRHEKDLRNITIIASVTGMAIAIPLVYFYDYIGATITILISRILLGTMTYVKYLKYKSK